MAKVSTTLKNIENEQQTQNKIINEKEQERKLKEDYKKDLKTIAKDVIECEFVDSNIDNTYNELCLNDYIYLEKIEKELSKIKTTITCSEWDYEFDTWRDKKYKIDKYANIYNIDDVEEVYYKVLKQVFTKYNNKNKINKNAMLEKLENDMRQFFKINNYNYAYNFMLDSDIRQMAIENLTGENYEYFGFIDKNYIRILNKVASEFKYKQQKSSKSNQNKGNIVTSHPLLLCGGGIIHGVIKGLKNVCK